MKILHVKDQEILLDDEDFIIFSQKHLCIRKTRKSSFVLVYTDGMIAEMLHRVLLNYPKERIGFKDGNTFNCQKSNLFIKDENYRGSAVKLYYQKNRDHILKKSKNWQINNKEKYDTNQRLYRSGKGKITKSLYRNRPEIKEHYNKYYKNKRSSLKYRYNYARNKSKTKGFEFALTFEQYVDILQKSCYYTGESILHEKGIGLDRIDNSKGYTIDNVLPCIGWVNKLRNNVLSVEKTKIAVNAILEYRNGKKDEQST